MKIEDLIRLLNENQADYVIIGAGRPLDLEDFRQLEEIQRQLKKGKTE